LKQINLNKLSNGFRLY